MMDILASKYLSISRSRNNRMEIHIRSRISCLAQFSGPEITVWRYTSNPEYLAWHATWVASIIADLSIGVSTSRTHLGTLQVIKEEVEKLLQAGFVRRVDYCEWAANPVLVKKANGKWLMCIDYTNLNDACPKNCYPMPNIDKLVEAASGNEKLSLLDAYSGYHQVPMALEDADKTSFYVGDEIYSYVMMLFGLKNAGATYQKMVTIVFRAQIGRNLEVYVDDIVVKSLKVGDHLIDLEETFNNLRKNMMRHRSVYLEDPPRDFTGSSKVKTWTEEGLLVWRVDYCEWVANPVLVKKANGKWRMCIDYTNLNDACPKNCYPMPNIDKLVEAASRNERLSLLDAYSGYHQVSMAPEDADKTSFYAGDEIYFYVMMLFDLKNAGATYQKMVTIVFRAQIGQNLEIYVDDIVVKSLKVGDHLIDLEETFNNFRKNRMRIKAVAEMEPPKSMKDVQRLTGRVATLHRLISKSADKCLSFFKIMRLATQKDESGKQKKFAWNSECQAAFDELKSYLSSPPLLTKADDGEILYLYLGISDEAISFVLVREEGKKQKPVYYISSVLHGAEVRYSIAEKAALAVVTSARKLRLYFQSHPIIVLTDQLLRQILQKPKCSRKLIKWAVELGEFEITFQQRSAIRAQALTDFIIECTSAHSDSQSEVDSWVLYVDGTSSNKGSGAGAILLGPNGYRSKHALKFNFDATNNMAEYEALLLSLQLATELKVEAIQIYSDSQLVVNKVNSVCEVVDPVMMKYATLVAELKSKFQKFHLSKIPRAENEQVDSLSKFASDGNQSSRSVFIEILDEPNFLKPRMMEVNTNPSSSSWTDPIISYLQDGTVPADKQEEMRLRKKASRYTLVNDVLYKRYFSLLLLRCLTPYEAEYALREVHEGVCESHVGARTLAHKVLRQGYYWPNIYKDAIQFVQRCQKYQFFAHIIHQPTEELTTLVAPWPFAQWGLDLLGPFMKGVEGVTHLIVGVDYFTKWVEARTLSSLTSKKFTSVYHLESNGMVESVNKCILEGETPYHLAFSIEAVIPIEIGVPSFRVTHFDEGRNGQLLRENLDLLDEVREEARLRTLVYKQKIANSYNKQVRPRTLKVGDLVLSKAGLTGYETRFEKLAPNWEGPYTVAEVPHPSAYVLQDTEGKKFPRVWNANNLKKFYP
ncbi:hypothetical protein SLEP1_g46157 [Rubroshorea leprosula]|uniref:RNase H type-1 domain-containing protein n=1 Tax=Rubroshorea leprosula TaxID=152421 RepID=A0AAV5LLC6_9ROSI|nr:hypothetical protein SLEP1_g46157 [Rubroshorea leprosula]